MTGQLWGTTEVYQMPQWQWGMMLMQLRVFLILLLSSAHMKIEVKWCFLALMATEAMGTPLYTHFPWTVGWLIEPHTSPQVPSIFSLTETHFRYLFSTLSEEACFSRRSWEVLRLGVVKGGCGFLFLLYKLALPLSCLYSRCSLSTPHSVASGKYAVRKRNSNQCLGRKITRTKHGFFSENNGKFSAPRMKVS